MVKVGIGLYTTSLIVCASMTPEGDTFYAPMHAISYLEHELYMKYSTRGGVSRPMQDSSSVFSRPHPRAIFCAQYLLMLYRIRVGRNRELFPGTVYVWEETGNCSLVPYTCGKKQGTVPWYRIRVGRNRELFPGTVYVWEETGNCSLVPYTSYISRVLYFVETGKSWFYKIFAVLIFMNGHRLTKYATLNPPRNIRLNYYFL